MMYQALFFVALGITASHAATCFTELVQDTPDFSTPTGSFRWGDFNVVSFNSVKANTGDIQGRVAARGNLDFGNGFSVGDQLETGIRPPVDRQVRDSAVAGGDLKWGSGAVYPDGSGHPFPGAAEGVFVAGSFSGPEYLKSRRDGAGCDGCLDDAFDNAKAYYTNLTSALSGPTDNMQATLEYGSGMFITGTVMAKKNTRYNLHIPAATFNKITWWSASNANLEAQFVITITGTEDVLFAGGQFPGLPERVIFNIPGKRAVAVSTEVVGSIIAPEATVTQDGGVIKGFLVAEDVTSLLQVNKPVCGGCDCCKLCEAESAPAVDPVKALEDAMYI